MPASDTRHRPWIVMQLRERGLIPEIRQILDVGCGEGSAQRFYHHHLPQAAWTGIEIWEPYDKMFGLTARYDKLIFGDAREMDLPDCDLCILGDVLEHMELDDATALYDKARQAASQAVVVGIPVREYPQGALYGNEHETHRVTWSTPMVLDNLPGIDAWTDDGGWVGAFIAPGLRS